MFRRFLIWWVPNLKLELDYEKHSIDLWGFLPANFRECLVYTVQWEKPPVVPSDLSFAAKNHCKQGSGAKWGSKEIGACTPKQQVIFDLVLWNQINEQTLWFWWIDSFRCICIDQTAMHPDDAADARSFLQKRTSYPPPFYFPPYL